MYVNVQRMREMRLTCRVSDLDLRPLIWTCDLARTFRYLQKWPKSVSVTPSIQSEYDGVAWAAVS